MAPYVLLAFSDKTHPQMCDAWTGVLAYTLQIYFDFSGYSDMAIGLARMFGVDISSQLRLAIQSH